MGCDLSAQLAADGAAAACYHDYLTADIADDGIDIHFHRLSSQQVFYFHIPQLADIDLAVYQLVHARQGAELTVGFLTDRKNVLQILSGNGGHGDNDLIDIVKVCTLDDALPASHYLDALNISSPLVLVVVDDAADDHGGKMTVEDLLDNDIGCLAGPDDHYCRGIFPVFIFVLQSPQETVGKPAGKDKSDQEKDIQKIKALGHRLVADAEKLQQDPVGHPGEGTGDHQVLQLCLSRKSPKAVIHAKQVKDDQRDHDIERQGIGDGIHKVIGHIPDPEVKTNQYR